MQKAEEGGNHILGKLSSSASVQVLEHHSHWQAQDHKTPPSEHHPWVLQL